MKNTQEEQIGRTVFWLLGLVGLGVLVFFVFKSDRTPEPIDIGNTAGVSAQTVVLEGEVVCLPHRDTSGPTTLECAYGLKTDDDKYYGLDASGLQTDRQGGYQTGERVSFEGTLVPQDQMPVNFWTTYNVVGLLLVKDYWQFRDK